MPKKNKNAKKHLNVTYPKKCNINSKGNIQKLRKYKKRKWQDYLKDIDNKELNLKKKID